jgi:hypothetical protein
MQALLPPAAQMNKLWMKVNTTVWLAGMIAASLLIVYWWMLVHCAVNSQMQALLHRCTSSG